MATELNQTFAPDHVPLSPKLALFDVDGTLRGKDGKISEKTKLSLAKLSASGCLIGLATGRPRFSALPLKKEIAVDGPSMLCTGAHLVDEHFQTKQILALEKEVSLRFLSSCRNREIGLELYSEEFYYVEKRTPLLEVHWTYQASPPEFLPDLGRLIHEQRMVKAQIVLDLPKVRELLPQLQAEFPQLRFAVAHGAAHPELSFISVVSDSASPDRMLDEILRSYHFTREEVISFGDGESDIPLLKSVGLGIAMGNSKPVVKDAALYVTKSVDEDGIAFALEKLFGISSNP